MVYLIILFIITVYLYLTENKKTLSFHKQFLIWLPAFIFYIFPLAFQYQVGTDYNTYYNYFFNNGHLLHSERGEFLYYYLVEFVVFLGDPQLQFVFVSIIQGYLFFYLLYLLKIKNYKSWLIFFLYFICTGIYHNQMNGLRQFICIYLVLINSILIYEKKYIKFSFISLFSTFIHFSSILTNVFLFFVKFIKIKNKNTLFFIFIGSFFVYLPSYKDLIFQLLSNFEIRYLTYFDSDFSESADVKTILTKFYYIPIVFIFWFYYIKDKARNCFFEFMILIFSLTYFLFLQSHDFALISRIWQYTNFFLIFPIYYVINKSVGLTKFLVVLYLLLFYIVKVIFFPTAEYSYSFYWEWF